MIIKITDKNSTNSDKDYYTGFAIVRKHYHKNAVKKNIENLLKEYKHRFLTIDRVGCREDNGVYIPQIMFKKDVRINVARYISDDFMKTLGEDKFIGKTEILIRQ